MYFDGGMTLEQKSDRNTSTSRRKRYKQKGPQTLMLPSNFKRSDTFNLLRDQMRSEMGEISTAGPADYNIERVIGKKHISQA